MVAKFKELKTGRSLAEAFKEGCRPRRAVLLVILLMMMLLLE
jgi:hypothetical protein